MSRKTIEIEKLVKYANEQLARTDERATPDWKAGICAMIGAALHACDAYGGWSYNYREWNEAGCPTGEEKEKFIYGPGGYAGSYDRTYYIKEQS